MEITKDAKKKKYKGHYCKVCGEIKANEQFTGKGHASHICKKCSKKAGPQQAEEIAINRIYKLVRYSNLSKQNRKMLEAYLHDRRENVRLASQEVMEMFTLRFRNNINNEDEKIYFSDIDDEIFCDDLEDDEEFFYYEPEEEEELVLSDDDLGELPF